MWFRGRRGKINGSKAATALGYGKVAMLDYWNELSSALHGTAHESRHTPNIAMLWGEMNEECALVTYLKWLVNTQRCSDKIVKKNF